MNNLSLLGVGAGLVLSFGAEATTCNTPWLDGNIQAFGPVPCLTPTVHDLAAANAVGDAVATTIHPGTETISSALGTVSVNGNSITICSAAGSCSTMGFASITVPAIILGAGAQKLSSFGAGFTCGVGGACTLAPSASGTLGGVQALTAVAHQFVTSVGTNGILTLAQPSTADISGLGAVATKGISGTGANALTTTGTLTNGHIAIFTSSGDVIDGGALGNAAFKGVSGTGSNALTTSGTVVTGHVLTYGASGDAVDGGAAAVASTTSCSTYTASGTYTYTIGAGVKWFSLLEVGAGSSGGNGTVSTSGTAASAGAGGSGGAIIETSVSAIGTLSGAQTVVIGAGGAVPTGNGAAGLQGGNTSAFGISAYGGGAPAGGAIGINAASGGSGSYQTAGGAASGATAGSTTGLGGSVGVAAAVGTTPTSRDMSASGGASTLVNGYSGGNALFGPAGGGAGGPIQVSAALLGGGNGGRSFAVSGFAAGGTTAGQAGSAGSTNVNEPFGGGGGGGANNIAGNGGAGGAGGNGAGGGGGGSSISGTGGLGGKGGDGGAVICTGS